MKTALITGVSGQGGTHLARLLLNDGYAVVGTTRDAKLVSTSNLEVLNINDHISLRSMDLRQADAVLDLVDQLRPDEIYHLAAPSSVARSFQQPAETIYSIALTTVNLLDAVRKTDKSIPCFIATSTEMFGNCYDAATVRTRHDPKSPYGIGKSCAHYQAKNYREAYGLYAVSGILSNFESPLRQRNYVTSKIVNAACEIAIGAASSIELGNLSVYRDWGSATDFMQAAKLSLRQTEPDDYLIATGVTHSLRDFLDTAFSVLGLAYEDHLLVKDALLRPLDIKQTLCDPTQTQEKLNWHVQSSFKDIITDMVYSELLSSVGEDAARKLVSPTNNLLVS